MSIFPSIPTTGSIAAHLGAPIHRVEYIIASRGIKPIGRAGMARVFSQADVEKIASALKGIARNKEAAHE